MYNPNLPNNGLGLYPNLSSQPYTSLPAASNVQSSFQIPQVSGENGAKAYQMPPNSSILLLDSTDNVIWCKTTDAGGFATLTGYKITPIENKAAAPDMTEYVTRKDFDELRYRFDKLMEDLGDGKSNS